ncbi:piggyBac transposable element-derived protein 4-like [Centruroides sculpturatus]|uniref:piggyBac transposable element-derived protein 4-like n=1 Tax=Centruroides sculpturatus TaxID=218467 RepID=UPI000C6D4908|nr:piggyBac transposable element-derived protein 4-like [Centruroides sculpturatus]XP_023213148.1 piggyBac transposable element-derived protein 4-like [Centruroides sculpturatus]
MSESEINGSEEDFNQMTYVSEYVSDLSSSKDKDYGPKHDVATPSTSTAHSGSDDEMEDQEYREVFSPEEPQPFPFPFREVSGPKHMPPPDSPPIVYFYLFFNSTLLSLMVEETNRYAQEVLNGMGNNVPSYWKNWTKVSVPEMKGFLACILNLGRKESSDHHRYWCTSPIQSESWFPEMFSQQRFCQLVSFFHFVDDSKLPGLGESGYDPCAKFQPLLNHANRVFRHHYTPHQEISINAICMGLKFWMMIDSVSSYCLGFFPFQRTESQQEDHSISELGSGYNVVQKLLEIDIYLNKGYHFFIDRCFMSVPLVLRLYSLQTYVTGTVRGDHKMLPQQFKKKFAAGETSYFRSGPVLACGFKEKQSQMYPIITLSSHAWARDVEVIRNGEAKLKPEIIQNHNKFISGVDISDVVLYACDDKSRPMKYWKNLAFNVIARMALNSYMLYKENFAGPGKVKSRHAYHVAVIESLAEEWMAIKLTTNNSQESETSRKKESP